MPQIAVLTIKVNGKPYTFRPGEITGLLSGEFRKASGGMTVSQAMSNPESADLDSIGGLIWLARRQAGEDVSWNEVLSDITYETEFEVSTNEADAAPEDPDSPQA